MDVSTTSFSPTQMILAWTLLALLVIWFLIFIALAIRDYVKKKVECEDIPAEYSSTPLIGVSAKVEHHNFIDKAGNTKNQEHANSELSSDSGTTLSR